ncbi:hypothetical protein GL218_04653 [Daldinia childiae]|uniref:uncharacterized protein n=1 Tax=Daldinia childiae TaxID=326645 RepID=UPI00144898D7|nr:uncharacterized protein GL218_04653 [Daldinia childiae]KAF3059866.1 hypothetical protein GL218_04653 [Daldinia childiae]
MATVASSLLPPDQPFRRRVPRLSSAAIRWRSRQEPQSFKRAFKYDQVNRSIRVSRLHDNRIIRQRRPRPSYPAWGFDDEDSRRLAADPNFALPSDCSRSKPRLERQEAFREPKTQGFYSDVVEDDSDLYKLGLLYDDEHTRGSYFSLDAIVHDEPVYSIRPAKRARKQRKEESYLHLDLSYALLSSDIDVGPFLAPEVHEILTPAEDISVTQDNREDKNDSARSYRDGTLSVIRELPESSAPSFEKAAPEAADFPDLVFDSEGEDEESHDWALLEDVDIMSNADVDTVAEDIVDATSVTGEAWVVLGDGS